MIEKIMIFALGFLVSGILALFFLPLFWRRALRLSRRRVEMQMPLSMAEVVAERDQLRAGFALERRRLEREMETLNAKRAREMSELARLQTEIGHRDANFVVLGRESSASKDELEAIRKHGQDLEAQFGALVKETHDAEALLARRTEDLAVEQRERYAVTQVAEERRALNAALETRLNGLEMRFADALRELETLRVDRDRTVTASRALSNRHDAAETTAFALGKEKRELEERVAAQARRLEELSASLSRAQSDGASVKTRSDELERELSFSEERAKALRNTLERHSDARRSSDDDDRYESLLSQGGRR